MVHRAPLHAALIVDNGGMAGFAASDASRAVLAFPRCSLDCRRPKDFGCGGDSTAAVLGRGYGHSDRGRGPGSVNCLEVPLFRSCCSLKVVDIPVSTQRLFPSVQTVVGPKKFPSCLTR